MPIKKPREMTLSNDKNEKAQRVNDANQKLQISALHSKAIIHDRLELKKKLIQNVDLDDMISQMKRNKKNKGN